MRLRSFLTRVPREVRCMYNNTIIRRILTSITGEPVGTGEASDTTILVAHFTLTMATITYQCSSCRLLYSLSIQLVMTPTPVLDIPPPPPLFFPFNRSDYCLVVLRSGETYFSADTLFHELTLMNLPAFLSGKVIPRSCNDT